MTVLDIRQRSPEWYLWRREGVTASVAAAVLGYDEKKTPWRVWAEYLGKVEPEDLSGNPLVRHGVRAEDWVRQAFERRHDDLALPCCVVSDEEPVCRASLDGLTSNGVPVEMKAPHLTTFMEVVAYGRASRPFLRYWIQVQHQIYVTGADHGWLCFLHERADEPYQEFRIERDERFIREELVPGVLEFWALVQKKKAPPRDPQRDVYMPEGDEATAWWQAVEAYRTAKTALEREEAVLAPLKEKVKEAENLIAELMGDYRMAYAFDLQATRFSRAGSIDYKRLVKDLLPQLTDADLERYRRPPGKPQLRVTDKGDPELAAKSKEKQQRHAREAIAALAEVTPMANW